MSSPPPQSDREGGPREAKTEVGSQQMRRARELVRVARRPWVKLRDNRIGGLHADEIPSHAHQRENLVHWEQGGLA